MLINKNNYYHPFTASYLGFFITVQDPSKEKEFNLILEDVDLYHQPVEDPKTGFIYLVFGLMILLVGEVVQFKLYQMVTKENGLVKEVTQMYTSVQMICYPILMTTISSTDFIHPLSEVIGSWYCRFTRIVGYLYFHTILQHSFVVALMRYLFIVHKEWVQKHGKAKIKRAFLILTFFMPVLMELWGILENDDLDHFLFINRCSGIDHKLFLSNQATLKAFSCHFENSDTNELVTGYSGIIRKTGCVTKVVLLSLLGLNVSEGFIYFAIFSHMKRYVFSVDFFNYNMMN